MNSPSDHAQSVSYEQLPYDSNPFFESHPERLATIALLSGLEPPPLEACRVLELGCASGGNLIPAAEAFPGATFVGVDLSPAQIADGSEVVRALGLKNITLHPMSLADMTPAFGAFDYIIAHGLYSWVPPEVQRRTLEICRAHLAPRGIVYISYNTLPGGHLRAGMRDMLLYGLEHQPADLPARARLGAARGFAEMILNAANEDTGDYTRLLQNEIGMVLKAPDSYIAHDHLEQFHEAVYFHDFASRAAAHGLMYLGDARFNKGPYLVASRLREQHPELLADPILFEQCVDFAFGRQFRRTLLCHAGQSVNRELIAERLMHCHLTASVFPTAAVDVTPGAHVTFKGWDGGTSTVTDPAVKIAFALLARVHPQSLSFDALWEQVRGMMRLPAAHEMREQLAVSLLSFVISDSVEPHLTPPLFMTQISARPVASPLARLQAARGQVIHNRRHRSVRSLNDADRAVLRLLDGSRDLNSLRADLFGSTASDEADRALRECLQRVAAQALLIG